METSLPATTSPVPPRRPARAILGIVILLVFFGGLFIGRYVLPGQPAPGAPLQFVSVQEGKRELVFPTFWEAWDVLHENFNGALDMPKLYYGAVEGMVRAAGDPYTVFADPDATKQFSETLSGSFSGIGIEIGLQSGVITVIAPLEGSPAAQAGIKTKDIIIAVDKKPITADASLDEVVRKIRGPKGSTVTLTVFHEGSKEPVDIAIKRDTIEVESVKLKIEEGIAHLSITNFRSDTTTAFNNAIREIQRAKVKGMLLDLRGNPGGFLESAVEISSRFLPEDALVVSEKGKENKDFKSKGSHPLLDIPTVVLVDSGSASASEIVAGALGDIRHAPIVGTKTFGKGSVQEFIKLKDGSSLRVTVAKWFTPSGRSINEQGIAPTSEVKNDPNTDTDEVLDRARAELKTIIK